ncbi:hypothetical protein ACWEWX_26960, partial [Streptomyces asiaticus]
MNALAPPSARLWAVDAGGSRTSALSDDGSRWSGGSVNPTSVGTPSAEGELARLLGQVASHMGGARSVGWIATASVADGTLVEQVGRIADIATRSGLTGTLVISRDVTPLLLAPPLSGRGLVVVCGTGSGVVAGGEDDKLVSVGG